MVSDAEQADAQIIDPAKVLFCASLPSQSGSHPPSGALAINWPTAEKTSDE
jgi:hypothetical protein